MAYRFRNQKSKRQSLMRSVAPLLATGFGFVAFALCVPSNSSQKSEARIFTQGVSIEIDRSSPAYAALEDSLMEDTQPSVEDSFNGSSVERRASEILISGKASAAPIAEKIVKDIKREEALYAQEHAARERAALAVVQALTTPQAKIELATAEKPKASAEASKAEATTPIEHPTVVLSLADLGVKSRAELAERLSAPIQQAAREVDMARSSRVAKNLREPQSAVTANPVRTLALNESAKTELRENQNEGLRQIVISGNLEFTGGIAVTSANDRVVIYREEDGEKLEPGAVWLRDARYEIFVDRPVGRLVAELRAISGEVLGRGLYDLDQLPKLAASQYRATGVQVKLGPVPHGIAGRVVTGAVANSKVFGLQNASVSFEQLPFQTVAGKDGAFDEPTLLEGSSVVTRTERQGSWGTLAIAHAGQSLDVSLYSDQAMRALIKAAAPTEMNSDRSSAYIWGRIVRDGRPVAGAKVDLMTTDRPMKPIYFNKLGMPDPTLTASSSNGLYAFFPVPPGAHALQAADSHGITEPNLFPTDARTVTQVDLELKVSQAAKVRVFDAFKTDFPLTAEVVSTGRNQGVMVPREGEAKVTFTGGTGLLILDSDAGSSYEKVRVSVSRTSKVVDFPMIQSSWLEGLRASQRVNAEPGTGTIVGFVRGSAPYQIALDEKSLAATSRVVYFDASGKISRTQFGESGGGFAVFNVPTGFRTILIQPSGTTRALGAAVLVDTTAVNVISKSLL